MHAKSAINGPRTDWEVQARMLRAIAHPVRMKILESLCEGPICVSDLNVLVTIPQPQLSQHMAALRKAEIIACHTNGPLRCYYISKPTMVKRLIRLCAQNHPVVEKDRSTVIREATKRREGSLL